MLALLLLPLGQANASAAEKAKGYPADRFASWSLQLPLHHFYLLRRELHARFIRYNFANES
jgi:hypothetical protein